MNQKKKLTDPKKSKQPIDACTESCPASKEETILIVQVKSYFWIRKEDGTLLPSGGPYNRRIRNFSAIEVLDANVTLVEKGLTLRTSEGQHGEKYAPAEFHIKPRLRKDRYTLFIEPPEARRSMGPAGKSTKGKVSKKANDLKARMYRSARVFVEINDLGKAVAAWVPWMPNAEKSESNPKDPKPPGAKPWDWNFASAWIEGECSDTVYVDLKPDWWSGFSSMNKDRKKRMKEQKVDQQIDLIVLHNTGAISNGDESNVNYKSIGAAMITGMKGAAGHYYVDLDGHVVKLYDERTVVTMHTDMKPGKCSGTWLGKSANARSIAIETARPWLGFQEWNQEGHTVKALDHLRKSQFDSIVRLIENLQSVEGNRAGNEEKEPEIPIAIPPHRIIGHSDGGDAHGGTCPGCDYWWDLLEKKGVGMIFPDDLTLDKVPEPYPNEDPVYTEWFRDNERVTENATKVVEKLIQDLKDIGYEVRGKTMQSCAFAIERFKRHFYSGSRYHLRYETLKKRDKHQIGALDSRGGVTPSTSVDRRLVLGIRAIADYVRSRQQLWNDMQETRRSAQRLEQLNLKF